ncbi:hypothetical protein [Gramella sp. MAR_2010_147]|uniref:hypothetical protein n=1 Tax=Gramella sp. MAR_2010_147 TaxID=1250205 RepID=UPI00267CF2ED
MHLEEAKQAIDYDNSYNFNLSYSFNNDNFAELISCKFFTTNILLIDKRYTKNFSFLDSFIIYICVEGKINIEAHGNTLNMEMGECILLPAISNIIEFFPEEKTKLLEVYI